MFVSRAISLALRRVADETELGVMKAIARSQIAPTASPITTLISVRVWQLVITPSASLVGVVGRSADHRHFFALLLQRFFEGR